MNYSFPETLKRTLRVKEIFFSLQGEGARTGSPNIFIRLAGCNKNCSFCDTDWKDGVDYTLDKLVPIISRYPCSSIIWTGGEPTLQLDEEIVEFFKEQGFYQAIETNGSNPVPLGIDYVTCSPKEGVTIRDLWENFNNKQLDEFRYLITKDTISGINNQLPDIENLPNAAHYFISPMFEGTLYVPEIVNACVEYIKSEYNWFNKYTNKLWKLSVQIHKIIGIA
mgnify:CR=1 FL=1